MTEKFEIAIYIYFFFFLLLLEIYLTLPLNNVQYSPELVQTSQRNLY